jgi:CHASE2 domain-containing sensor protein/signal transduction histidine kinase
VEARPAARDVVIVAIDDESVSRIGKWPWSRATHAALVRVLTAAKPRAILYDVLFTEAGSGDAELAAALAVAPPTVLPYLFETPGRNGSPISSRGPVFAIGSADIRLGHAVLTADVDGISRRVNLIERVDGQAVPHVAVLATGGLAPTGPSTRLIAYARHGAFTTIPFAAIVDGTVPADFLRDRIVLVGSTAQGLGDRYATPVSSDGGLYPGVEILANIVGNLRQGALITDAGALGSFALLAIVLALLAGAFLIFAPALNILAVVMLAGGAVIVSGIMLRFGLWCDPAPSLLSLLVLFPAWGWHRLGQASRSIDGQLAILRADDGLLGPDEPESWHGNDPIGRRVAALDSAIARNLDLRRFVQTSFDSLPDVAIVVRETGAIILINGAARKLYARYDRSGQPAEGGALLRHIMLATHVGRAGLSDLLKGGAADDQPLQAEIQTVDDHFFNVSKTAFRTSLNAERFFIVRLVDITPVRLAERERERALEFLSHDLRAPQASLIGLLDKAAATVPEDLRLRLRQLAQRTIAMAQAFIEIARARSGKVVVRDIDLNDAAQEVIDSLWPDLKAKQLRTALKLSAEPLVVRVDDLLVARALTNIVQNAIRFSPEGAILTLRLQRRVATDGTVMAACLIDDQGPGIAPEHRALIFNRFESGSRGTGGTGLGLAMVAATVTRFAGSVRCYSREGLGTRFVFALPLQDDGAVFDDD